MPLVVVPANYTSVIDRGGNTVTTVLVWCTAQVNDRAVVLAIKKRADCHPVGGRFGILPIDRDY
jgi:hypothetical protein